MSSQERLSGTCLIQKVLVAVDGSENSERAIDFAMVFAEKYCTTLTVLNVTELPAAMYPGNELMVVAKDLRKIHNAILHRAVERIKATNPGLIVQAVLREGEPATEIVAVSKDGEFDVVVLGHLGVGKVKGLLMGSISEKVVRLVHCTVIVVK